MKAIPQVLLIIIVALVSACSGGGTSSTAPVENSAETPLGAANPGTESPTGEMPTTSTGNETTDNPDGETSGEGTSATGESEPTEPEPESAEPEPTEPPVETPPAEENNPPANPLPTISFQGSSPAGEYTVADTIVLDASLSTVDGAEIISYQWEQVDNGMPVVSLVNASSATASFEATAEIDGASLSFNVTVAASNGTTSSSSLDRSWTIVVPEIISPPSPNPTAIGNFSLVKAGGFFAENVESLYIANQQDQTLDHINPVTGDVLHTFTLTHIPTLVEYIASSRSLYVGLSGVGEMVKIDLETNQPSTITVPGEVQSLTVQDSRLFFTVEQSSNKWDLYSIGADNLQSIHGVVGGNLIVSNPANGEIIAAMPGTAPASVFRYTLGVAGAITETQLSRDLGNNARDLAISKDGLRLAVVTGSGNNLGFTIHNIQANDLTVSSGAWDTGQFPISGDFADSGDLFAASNDTDLMIFDAKSYVLKETHEVDGSLCGLGFNHLTQVLYSEDDHHIFAKLVCGINREKSVFFFFPKY